MAVDHLLFESLIPGVTLAEDKGSGSRTSANLHRGNGESVLVFHLDNVLTRRKLELSERKCCDFVFFFKSETQCTLIFVELKGGDIASAEEQIVAAYQAMSAQSAYVRSCGPLPVIVSSVTAPMNRKDIQKRMKGMGITLYFAISRKGKPCELKDVITELSARDGRRSP
jgi:hypothetical protein